MLSLIITIIATLILASIVIFSSMSAPKSASFSSFVDEVNNIRTSLGIVRNNNLLEHDDANKDFFRVTVENAPDRFITFQNNEGKQIGYVIDMEKIGIPEVKRGLGTFEDEKVTFGVEDVYVYDKNGPVFFVQGYENEGKIYYNSSAFVEE